MLFFKKLKRYRQILSVAQRMKIIPITKRIGLSKEVDVGSLFSNPVFARNFKLGLETLGPTFIKIGQIMSTRLDIFPINFINQLEQLQDSVSQVSFEKIKEELDTELHQKTEEIFSWINPEPLASASLGQVHDARLMSGEEVVIKILKPGIVDQVMLDCYILYDIIRLLEDRLEWARQINLLRLFHEFVSTLQDELDLQHEAMHIEKIRKIHEHTPFIKIPHVYWDYCTTKILVLEKINGIKINQKAKLIEAGLDPKQIIQNNLHRIIIEALGEGYFHADPHPGNFFVGEDNVIQMVDFGMVGILDQKMRVLLVQFLWAAINEDVDEIIRRVAQIGFIPEDIDRSMLARDIQKFVTYYFKLPLNRFPVQGMLNDFTAMFSKYRITYPPQIPLFMKTLSMLEGLVIQLTPDLVLIDEIKPFIQEQLTKYKNIEATTKILLNKAKQTGETILDLPSQVHQLLVLINEGKLKVGFQDKTVDHLFIHLKGIFNQILLTFITVSLILATSLIIKDFTGGYWDVVKYIAMGTGFTMAIGLISIQLWSILSDVRYERRFHRTRRDVSPLRIFINQEEKKKGNHHRHTQTN